MKKTFLAILSLALLVISAQAQYVEYEYDVSGNRIRRETIPVKLSNNSTTKKSTKPIETIWNEREVTVYPNPTKGNLSIRIQNGEEECQYNYSLYNTSGQMLRQGKFKNNGRHGIPLHEYKPGIYILQVTTKDEKLNFRIMKE